MKRRAIARDDGTNCFFVSVLSSMVAYTPVMMNFRILWLRKERRFRDEERVSPGGSTVAVDHIYSKRLLSLKRSWNGHLGKTLMADRSC